MTLAQGSPTNFRGGMSLVPQKQPLWGIECCIVAVGAPSHTPTAVGWLKKSLMTEAMNSF
jgi:hypothetical protein